MSGDIAYFDVIENEHKAYWLGFLTADGTLRPRAIELELHNRDREHVYAFRDAVGSSNTIKEKPGRVRVAVCSVHMARRLAALDFKHQPPELRAGLMRHYWRGVVDGDGSLNWQRSTTNRAGGDWNLTLVGNTEIVHGFADFAAVHAGKPRVHPYSSIWRVDYWGSRARRLVPVLYRDVSVALPRKKARAEQLMSEMEVAA